jgi:xanthine dehydrogenase YagR molybdenum-binding subunit
MGIGMTVLEETAYDPAGRIANNALGIKGVGDIGTIGVSAAIANAVFHATGRRFRFLPIKIEQLL